MSDKYFEDKAKEIFNKIHENEGWGKDSIFRLDDPTCKAIYLGLKETARDQRYACVDAITDTGYEFENIFHSKVMNANIKI